MKHNILLAFAAFLLCSVSMFSDVRPAQEAYIRKYSKTAVSEMYRSGIPASITLAQGMLESGAGQSRLAVEGNNHFGIKCHNWSGKKIYEDDDRTQECFRKYGSAEESYRDHSDFLRYKDRYSFLFDLDPADYRGWAYGLRKAGYATDPNYPKKLIKIIEDYRLYEYDTKPSEYSEGDSSGDDDSENAKSVEETQAKSKPGKGAQSKSGKDAQSKSGKDSPSVRPESPSRIETPKPLDEKQRETFRFSLSRATYSLNGVPFVYSVEGETYASIAKEYNLFLREILKFNDLTASRELRPGTVVYLQKKKSQAAKGLEKHVWEADDDLWAVSQRYAVKLSKLLKMNGVKSNSDLIEGDLIVLRK